NSSERVRRCFFFQLLDVTSAVDEKFQNLRHACRATRWTEAFDSPAGLCYFSLCRTTLACRVLPEKVRLIHTVGSHFRLRIRSKIKADVLSRFSGLERNILVFCFA